MLWPTETTAVQLKEICTQREIQKLWDAIGIVLNWKREGKGIKCFVGYFPSMICLSGIGWI